MIRKRILGFIRRCRQRRQGSPFRVTAAETRGNMHMFVEFADGESGLVDMRIIFDGDERCEHLLDQSELNNFRIDGHTLCWGEIDVCNHWLYSLATGKTDSEMYGLATEQTSAIHA